MFWSGFWMGEKMEVSKAKTVVPTGLFGGQPLLGKDYGEKVGGALDAAHVSKDSLLADRHSNLTRAEHRALSVMQCVEDTFQAIAESEDSTLKARIDRDGDGYVQDGGAAVQNDWAALAYVLERFAVRWSWNSGGIDNVRAEQATRVGEAYARAQAEAEKGAMGKIKKLMGGSP